MTLPPSGPLRSGRRVVAVVVSYNRAELLRECLAGVTAQTRPADAVVVVDNASTDGSADLVASEFPKADLVRLTTNTGGAGGFAAGMAQALDRHGADLVWVMDDDTVPSTTTLEALLAAEQDYPDDLQLVASRVTWTDGRDQDRNIPRPVILARARRRHAAALAGGRPMRTACFVSLLVTADAIRRHGLPTADFFIWNDDFEFTARILRRSPGIYLPRATVVHKTRELGTRTADPGDRFYYEVRNKVWTFRDGAAFGFPEVLLRVAIAVVNWARFFAHSGDREVLRTALVRGLRDGLRARPRPNREVLREAGYELGAAW
ncbi:glycosyltransferase [Nostocoides sp. HKS02]|uniref:glycosyltransferase n=1 Tax=Nostocoides sp. HKS02 TaxID=1813880 RepID=UPI00272B6DEA|nr:glycosyltransferase [Tetrasphaera sp. HKS02]